MRRDVASGPISEGYEVYFSYVVRSEKISMHLIGDDMKL